MTSLSLPRGRRAATMSALTLAIAGLGAGVAHASSGSASTSTSNSSGSSSTSSTRPGQGPRLGPPPHGRGPGRGHPGLDGLVTKVGTGSFTVELFDGATKTFLTTSATRIGVAPGTTGGALAPGEHVVVTVASTTSQTPTATEVTVLPARVDGLVASVSGDTLTVLDHEGFRRAVQLSSTTVFAGLTRAELTVGRPIVATGTVASDGTTLDAVRIALPPVRPVPPGPPAPPSGTP